MKKEKIIQQEISKTIIVPVIDRVLSDDYMSVYGYEIAGYDKVKVVDPEKLSKFLSKYVKSKDLVE